MKRLTTGVIAAAILASGTMVSLAPQASAATSAITFETKIYQVVKYTPRTQTQVNTMNKAFADGVLTYKEDVAMRSFSKYKFVTLKGPSHLQSNENVNDEIYYMQTVNSINSKAGSAMGKAKSTFDNYFSTPTAIKGKSTTVVWSVRYSKGTNKSTGWGTKKNINQDYYAAS